VLRLLGDGAWEMHDAEGYQFDGAVVPLRGSGGGTGAGTGASLQLVTPAPVMAATG